MLHPNQVGAEKYRRMREAGETPLPAPVLLEGGKDINLPSRDPNRQIPCRVFQPSNGKPKGVFYHIHGGGWVLQTQKAQDPYLKFLADQCQLAVVSVGYRLAPEHPYPAPNEDCYDVGEYLVDNAEKDYGAPLQFLGGESAGGHLSAVTCFHLFKSRPNFAFKGLVLNYGCYDLSGFLPQAHNFKLPLVLDAEIMGKFVEAYTEGKSVADRRDPDISPFFADLEKIRGKLPPALFTVGSLDMLLDDSVMMATKWMMAGNEGILKIYPGAPHGFSAFPRSVGTETVAAVLDDIAAFVEDKS
jgi:acetyl esterase/lipase